jgi:YVTN family beta-propeller protein
VADTITVGAGPKGIAITPDGKYAYVANYTDGTVSVIDASDNAVVKTVTVGTHPNAVAITPDGSSAYVTSNSAVNVIDIASNTVASTVTLPIITGLVKTVNDVVISPDGQYAYASFIGNAPGFTAANGSVSVIAIPPVLSNPNVTPSVTTANFKVTDNLAATAYWQVIPATPGATCPDIGDAGYKPGGNAMRAVTAYPGALTGLTASTQYLLCVYAKATNGLDSNLLTVPFTTLGVGPGGAAPIPMLGDMALALLAVLLGISAVAVHRRGR